MKKFCLLGIIIGSLMQQLPLCASDLEDDSYFLDSPAKQNSQNAKDDTMAKMDENNQQLMTLCNQALLDLEKSAAKSRKVSALGSLVLGGVSGGVAVVLGPWGLVAIPVGAGVSGALSHYNHPTLSTQNEPELNPIPRIAQPDFSEEPSSTVSGQNESLELTSPMSLKDTLVKDRFSITWQTALATTVVGTLVYFGLSSSSSSS